MRFASTGTRARLRSYLADRNRGRAGYLLLEALVALALVLAFAAVLGPVLFQARQIMSDADDRVAAQALLRSLLDAPLDRAAFANDARQGKSGDLRWRISATPMHLDGASGRGDDNSSGAQQSGWKTYRVVASVSWGSEHTITAETMRLGKVQ